MKRTSRLNFFVFIFEQKKKLSRIWEQNWNWKIFPPTHQKQPKIRRRRQQIINDSLRFTNNIEFDYLFQKKTSLHFFKTQLHCNHQIKIIFMNILADFKYSKSCLSFSLALSAHNIVVTINNHILFLLHRIKSKREKKTHTFIFLQNSRRRRRRRRQNQRQTTSTHANTKRII